MANWVGCAVSVNCGETLGCYQGTIIETDGTTITLSKAFRNGFPYPKSQVTLNAADIQDLKIIEINSQQAEQTRSTVSVSKSAKKAARNTVCETLKANPGSNVKSCTAAPNGGTSTPVRSKPIDIQPRHKNSAPGGSLGTCSTPKSRSAGAGPAVVPLRRHNQCLASTDASDPALALDFDFETNLALFDKQGLWEQMRLSNKPDLLRQTEECGGRSYRHDENVLGQAPAVRGIVLEGGGGCEYVTDDGVRVPGASAALQASMWAALERHGLLDSALTLLARAAADLVLRLVGGGRRLEARNAHQAPVVVLVADDTRAAAAGTDCCRLLESHGVRTAVLTVGAPRQAQLCRALAHYQLAGGHVARVVAELPGPDLVLVALGEPSTPAAAAAAAWACSARCGCLALDSPGVAARAQLTALLPPAPLPGPPCAPLYLADVAPPPAILRELGVHYVPPFRGTTLLALHPADD